MKLWLKPKLGETRGGAEGWESQKENAGYSRCIETLVRTDKKNHSKVIKRREEMSTVPYIWKRLPSPWLQKVMSHFRIVFEF